MQPRRTIRWLFALALMLGLVPLPLFAQTTEAVRDPRRLAVFAEQRHDWSQAVARYETLLRKDRENPELRGSLLRCLRRANIARRHRDPSYETALSHLTPSQALDIYQQVLLIVPSVYVDSYRTSLPDLFASGVKEVQFALQDEAFQQLYLPEIAAANLMKEVLARLDRLGERRPGPTTREQARDLVFSIAQQIRELNLPVRKNFLVALAFEMTAGACNTLDEYTTFLTPGAVANGALGINLPVSVGLDVAENMGAEIVVTRVFPGGPAQQAGLLPEDRLLRIDGQMAAGLTAEGILDRLRGPVSSLVTIEYLRPGEMMSRTVQLARRSVPVPTVEHRILLDPMGAEDTDRVGYLRITAFHGSTLQDVKEALAQLQTHGARGVVLDLRGNGGGLFESAVKVAELFLPEGQLIVRGESPVRQFNQPFAVSGGNPLTLPLAVLVDGDTASAAEVLVGALKDSNRARLLGQPTFGKGLIQCIIPVTRPGPSGQLATALKITVARFFTPSKSPVTHRGIMPHDLLEMEGETAIAAARLYLLGVLRSMNVR